MKKLTLLLMVAGFMSAGIKAGPPIIRDELPTVEQPVEPWTGGELGIAHGMVCCNECNNACNGDANCLQNCKPGVDCNSECIAPALSSSDF